ncbi:MAG: RNA polymerase alpha subunit C-terminal domain-containing protein [Mucilaginibacter sp.]
MATQKTLRTCDNGHQYYKSSDCPVCPVCENERKADESPFGTLGAPARRALENNGISNLKQLSAYSEKQILKLHGMGPGSMPKLRGLLEEQGLSFKSA